MLKVSWIGHGIVIVDAAGAGELHIRYLESDFLRGANFPVEVEELIRTLYNEHRAVCVELHFDGGCWVANAEIEIDAWTVVPHTGKGETQVEALSNLIHGITKN